MTRTHVNTYRFTTFWFFLSVFFSSCNRELICTEPSATTTATSRPYASTIADPPTEIDVLVPDWESVDSGAMVAAVVAIVVAEAVAGVVVVEEKEEEGMVVAAGVVAAGVIGK